MANTDYQHIATAPTQFRIITEDIFICDLAISSERIDKCMIYSAMAYQRKLHEIMTTIAVTHMTYNVKQEFSNDFLEETFMGRKCSRRSKSATYKYGNT